MNGIGSSKSVLHIGMPEGNASLFLAAQVATLLDKVIWTPQGAGVMKVCRGN